MGKGLMIGAAIGVCFCVVALIVVSYVVSTNNKAVGFKTAIEAKKLDNSNELDLMFKTISQSAQVTEANKQALKEIFNGYAEARSSSQPANGALATWIKEAVPNVDLSTFKNLQNIIVSARDRWTMRQKELIDLSREYENLLQKFPSKIVCSALGFKSIPIVIVTSTRTQEAMRTGVDDDDTVFKK